MAADWADLTTVLSGNPSIYRVESDGRDPTCPEPFPGEKTCINEALSCETCGVKIVKDTQVAKKEASGAMRVLSSISSKRGGWRFAAFPIINRAPRLYVTIQRQNKYGLVFHNFPDGIIATHLTNMWRRGDERDFQYALLEVAIHGLAWLHMTHGDSFIAGDMKMANMLFNTNHHHNGYAKYVTIDYGSVQSPLNLDTVQFTQDYVSPLLRSGDESKKLWVLMGLESHWTEFNSSLQPADSALSGSSVRVGSSASAAASASMELLRAPSVSGPVSRDMFPGPPQRVESSSRPVEPPRPPEYRQLADFHHFGASIVEYVVNLGVLDEVTDETIKVIAATLFTDPTARADARIAKLLQLFNGQLSDRARPIIETLTSIGVECPKVTDGRPSPSSPSHGMSKKSRILGGGSSVASKKAMSRPTESRAAAKASIVKEEIDRANRLYDALKLRLWREAYDKKTRRSAPSWGSRRGGGSECDHRAT